MTIFPEVRAQSITLILWLPVDLPMDKAEALISSRTSQQSSLGEQDDLQRMKLCQHGIVSRDAEYRQLSITQRYNKLRLGARKATRGDRECERIILKHKVL